jgi:hypothetical protein
MNLARLEASVKGERTAIKADKFPGLPIKSHTVAATRSNGIDISYQLYI